MGERPDQRDIIPVEARPVTEVPGKPGRIPRIVAGTVNICINCVQGAGRMVRDPIRRRHDRHYHSRHRHGRKHLIADLAFAAAILVLLSVNGYLLLSRGRVAPSAVRLAFGSPSLTAAAGGPVELALTYRNQGRERLDAVQIVLAFPEELAVASVIPGTFHAGTKTVTIGAVEAGQEGTVTLSGVLLAATGSTIEVGATFHGQRASTAERAMARATVAASGIALLPPSLETRVIPTRGESFGFLWVPEDVRGSFDDVVFRAKSVRGVTVEVGETPSDIRRPYSLQIRTNDAAAGPHRIPFEVRVRSGDREWSLGTAEAGIEVTAIPVALAVRRTGSGAIALGAAETIEVTYAKTGGDRLNAVALGAAIRGTTLPGTAIDAKGGRIASGRPTWDLGTLEGGASGARTFTIRLPNRIDSAAYGSETRFLYVIVPTLVLEATPNGSPLVVAEGRSIEVPIRGDLRLASFARYHSAEGDQLGRGPLPPRVGQTTRYWVTWDIRALIEASDRVVVRAALSPGVEWTGKTATTAGEQLAFDPATRTVTWAVGGIDRSIGKDVLAATASFEVALIPTPQQVGTFVSLLGATHVEGVGRTTGAAIIADAAPVTTELPLDQRAVGKGKVQ